MTEFQDTKPDGISLETHRKHLFIINPRSFRYSGGTGEILSKIRGHFQKTGGDYHIHISRYPRDAVGVIQKYKDAAPPDARVRVYAVGGDGTLFDCVNGVIGLPNMELAAMPYGSTNDFARSFGDKSIDILKDIELQTAAEETVKTDVIRCDSNYAMNVCLIGVDSAGAMTSVRVSRALEARLHGLTRGIMPAIYLLCGISGPMNKKVRMQHYDVTIDDTALSGNFAGINIANGPCFGGGKSAVITAMPNDGILNFLASKSVSLLKIIGMIPDYISGNFHKHPDIFTYRRGKKIVVRSDQPLRVNLDGETFFDTNIDIEVVPGAIDFVAPCGLQYERRAEEREPQ